MQSTLFGLGMRNLCNIGGEENVFLSLMSVLTTVRQGFTSIGLKYSMNFLHHGYGVEQLCDLFRIFEMVIHDECPMDDRLSRL